MIITEKKNTFINKSGKFDNCYLLIVSLKLSS